MSKLKSCTYGGGSSCQKQGGDGSTAHGAGYVHPFPHLSELGEPVGDEVAPLSKAERTVSVLGLDSFFDEDMAEEVLRLSLSDMIAVDRLAKSLYDFDIDTEDGIKKLLELLPVLDPEIIIDVMEEIWPGYVADDVDPDLMRAEIKGYFLDYLRDKVA